MKYEIPTLSKWITIDRTIDPHLIEEIDHLSWDFAVSNGNSIAKKLAKNTATPYITIGIAILNLLVNNSAAYGDTKAANLDMATALPNPVDLTFVG